MSVRSSVGKTLRQRLPDPVFQQVARADRLARRGRQAALRRLAPAPAPAAKKPKAARPTFPALAKKHGTDKWGAHRYAKHYQRHLQPFRDDEFNLLEIGIGGYQRAGKGGASLRAWEEFFPKAQIVGLDIEDKSFVDGGRIRSYQGSQDDPELLQRIHRDSGPFLVIIDDGSHRPHHIRDSFAVLYPLLLDGGVYVIEDVQTSYWPEFGGSRDRNDPTTSMALVKDLVDGLNYEEYDDDDYQPSYTDLNVVAVHCYHNLVIIEKGSNTEGTQRRKILGARRAAT
jgi:hypothetical protein